MRSLRLNTEIELFTAGIAAAQSLFMALSSLFERKRDFRNILLFLFFIAISLRLTKSILWVYLDHTPLWLINTGFAAHALSGPALLLYIWHVLYPKKWLQMNFIHFVPVLILVVGIPYLSLSGFWYSGGYSALLFHQLGYSIGGLALLAFHFLNPNPKVKPNRATYIWITALTLGTALLQFLYFSNYILGATPYMLGPIIYLPLVYFLAFLLFKNPSLLHYPGDRKGQNIKLSNAELELAAQKLETVMQQQQLYLDPNCTMTKVAKAAKMPPYLVSHVVNNSIGKSFPDFLNGFRVEEIKVKLIQPKYQNTKIANIAYDCGFNTISSFNAAFKKLTGTTPTKFQKANRP